MEQISFSYFCRGSPSDHFCRGLATDFGLGPGANEIGQITRVIPDIGKRNCDVISKHINDFVIFLHKNLNSGITL